MHAEPLSRRLLAEGLGSALLAATVVGSGIMAQRLAGGNVAIALLANTAATAAVLYTLISLFGPISGAHFNPAVSGIEALRGRLLWRDAGAYAATQILGCCAGAILAHLMFELPVWQLSTHVRSGPAQWLAEATATLGLLLVVIGHRRAEDAGNAGRRCAPRRGARHRHAAGFREVHRARRRTLARCGRERPHGEAVATDSPRRRPSPSPCAICRARCGRRHRNPPPIQASAQSPGRPAPFGFRGIPAPFCWHRRVCG